LLDVVTYKQELSMPPVITLAEVKGFGLWGLRAVLNGRGDALIDLAQHGNLFKSLMG
jgi:pyruvate dehydrogenase (quinone)